MSSTHSPRPGDNAHPQIDPLGGTLLTIDAHGAMELAAASRGRRPLGTLDILAALVAMDAVGSWQTVLLRTSFVAPDDALRFPDHDPGPAGAWHNVPLTGDATTALATAARIARDYDLRPMPPGVLALGLVWDPRCGAARALLEGADIDHPGLVELLQLELLDVRLEGLVDNRSAEDSGAPATRQGPSVEDSGTRATRQGRSVEDSPARSERWDPAEAQPERIPRAGVTPATQEPLAVALPATQGPFAGALTPSAPASLAAASSAGAAPLAAGAGAGAPAFTGALGERLATATLLRQPDRRGTQPWVYQAGDRVLKIYRLQALSEAEQRQVRAGASVGLALADSDGVVPTLAVYDEQGYLVVEMPHMGPSLDDHLRASARDGGQRLTSEQYVQAIARVAAALHELHGRGLVHGHLTPANLLVDPGTGWLTVSDLSNAPSDAIPTEPGRSTRRSFARAAAPVRDRYIAPEQYDGERGPSVDQYALGVVARELLTAPGAPNLTAPVHDVLQRATAPRPADRFETTAAFGTALKQAVHDEAPQGFADRIAALKPHHRAALVPALLAVFGAVVYTSIDATDGPTLVSIVLLETLVALPTTAAVVWGTVVLAGALRRRIPLRTFTIPRQDSVALIAAAAIFAAWIATAEDPNWVSAVWYTLFGIYGGLALIVGAPANAGSGLVRIARRWDRRRMLSRPRRWAVSTGVFGVALALVTAPAIAASIWPGALPDRPAADYGALASVWNFRAFVGGRAAQRACDDVVELAPAPQRARCVDTARIAGALQRADPISRMPGRVFGAGDSFETFRVQQIPAAGDTIAWRLLTRSGGPAVGFMYTEGASRDRITVLLDRDQSDAENAPARSMWLYELVQRPKAWKITGFRACVVGKPGSGIAPAKCQITDLAKPDVVKRLLAAARKKGIEL